MNLLNATNAAYQAKRALHRHGTYVVTELWIDKHRKALLRTDQQTWILLLFKKEFFRSYGAITGDKSGAGESINLSDLQQAEEKGATLIYCYPDGRVYETTTEQVRTGYHYTNKADGREQLLFPLSTLRRLA